jgi:hypothetical protein
MANNVPSTTTSSTGRCTTADGSVVAAAPPGGRVDGKDFFKHARNRLSYEGFHEFLQVCVAHGALVMG